MRKPTSATADQKLTERHPILVDVRSAAEFAQGHPKGAMSLPFSARGLAERLAVIVEPGTQIDLLASEPAVSVAALAQLRDWYRVVGVMDRSAWRQTGALEESLPDIPVQVLANAVPAGDVTVLDVREPVEWETGYAPGAVLISLGSLGDKLDVIPHEKLVAIICEAGVRSSTGASLLLAAGFPRVATVSEGMSGYRRAGLPLQFPEIREQS